MPTLTIRNLKPETHTAIRQEAVKNNESMETEVRQFLTERFNQPRRTPLEIALRAHSKLKNHPELPDFLDREQTPLHAPKAVREPNYLAEELVDF
jgi:plasmid stability protein